MCPSGSGSPSRRRCRPARARSSACSSPFFLSSKKLISSDRRFRGQKTLDHHFPLLARLVFQESSARSLAGRILPLLSTQRDSDPCTLFLLFPSSKQRKISIMNVVTATAGATTAAAQGDVADVDASAPPAPVPRPRRFPCLGDSPGPRCGHTLTAITGPDGNLASARLVLFGAREERERERRGSEMAIGLFLDGIADARLFRPSRLMSTRQT